jgi:hypothetical protein
MIKLDASAGLSASGDASLDDDSANAALSAAVGVFVSGD